MTGSRPTTAIAILIRARRERIMMTQDEAARAAGMRQPHWWISSGMSPRRRA